MTESRDLVLLLTHSEDFYVPECVEDALKRRGLRSLRLDTDRYPRDWSLSQRCGAARPALRLISGDMVAAAAHVRAVWVRHWTPPQVDERMDPAFREACVRSATLALRGFFESLEAVRWLSEPARVLEAFGKVRQLRAAERAGLIVPRTLVSNHPADVRAFYEEVGGRMVTKMLSNLSSSMGRAPRFVRTSVVTPEHLERLDDLRHCPMIFQERVTKACELRVAYLDGRCFVGRIDAPDLVDWRTASPDELQWRPDALPAAESAALRRLMDALGLGYGAIDLIRTPEGAHVFLEVNPTGEWGMLERDLGLPISEAIAAALAGEAAA